jgi:AcrR family transcriptional regulator
MAADVSAETVYAAFGGKQRLMQGVTGAAILGESSGGGGGGQWVHDILALPAPRQRLRARAAHACTHLSATRAVHTMIRGAADSEPFAAELRARLLAERLALHTLRCNQFLRGHLRAGLTVEQAAQRYCALLSPELHHLLTSELGWRADHHREWVSALLERDLLTDP